MIRRVALFTALLGLVPSGLSQTTSGPARSDAAACALPAGPLPTRTRAVFVLDTSGSMQGLGDGKAVIFGRVTAAISTYVRATRPDRVELLTFDAGVRSRQSFEAPAGTARWNAALAALKADGSNTHLYRSVHAALSPLTGAGTYLTTVFVLTDGIDNDPQQSVTPDRALAAFAGRGPLDRLHYVALGTGIPAAARRALEASGYADGVTLPVGTSPDLVRTGTGGGLLTVTDTAGLPVPFLSGTALQLGTGPASAPVRLATPTVQGGRVRLTLAGNVPYGAPALLCAAPVGNGVRPGQVLLRVALPGTARLRLLNPAADRALATGEDVVLRYAAPIGQRVEGTRIVNAPAGLRAEVWAPPGSRLITLRLTNTGLGVGTRVSPTLLLPGGLGVTVPTVTGAPGGRTPLVSPAATGDSRSAVAAPAAGAGWTRWLPWALLALLLVGAAVVGLRRRSRGAPVRPVRATPPVAAAPGVPAVEGIEYSEDRLLSLVGVNGEVTGVSTPLDGPFDVGHLARVPHLSGLRFEQHLHGLRCTQIPPDIEVSQGARLLRAGDIVRPATLLGVAVARPARAPSLPLGSLAGLGLPLTLSTHGQTVHVVGPYGEHALTLRPGLTDVGDSLDAPALRGLRLAVTGGVVLLAERPDSLGLRRPGEGESIRPGTALSGMLTLDLPGDVPR